MVTLNLDCWEIVFQYLDNDHRALYNCLLVSKTFFHFSVPLLYRHPFDTNNYLDPLQPQQRPLSTFSTSRLNNLLEVCAGFNPLSTTPSTTTTTTVQISPMALPTTINYYHLINEYPQSVSVRQNNIRGQEQLSYFAETIPILYIEPQYLDLLLPIISKCRALHTLHIYSSTRSNMGSFGSKDLEKIIRLIETHQQFFPGQLCCLSNDSNWRDRNEMVKVVTAMGGMKKQRIEIVLWDQGLNLNQLIVSKLKDLNLICNNLEDIGGIMETRVIEFLKNCKALERLEMRWPKGTVLNWSLLLEENDSFERKKEEQEKANGHDGDGDGGGQVQQQRNRSTQRISLKHLAFYGNPTLAIQAMNVFKESLESIQFIWNYDHVLNLSPLDWKTSFSMPKLKSIVCDRIFLVIQNLSCCPNLETLVLNGTTIYMGQRYWPLATAIIEPSQFLPVSIRKLDLRQIPGKQFNPWWLKPLINLEYLHLDSAVGHDHQSTDCSMIDMSSVDGGWWFPNLRHVALFGKFAISIQGQILWLAPKLEYLNLYFWCNHREGLLDTDTFLFPPSVLNFTKTVLLPQERYGMDAWSRMIITDPVSESLVSTASFPNLKSLKLTSFELSKIQKPKTFGDLFFSPRREQPGGIVGRGIVDGGGGGSDIEDEKKFVFPNLEDINISSDYLQPSCVLQAMRNLRKLESLRCQQPQATLFDSLEKWLLKVPKDELGNRHPNYRNRPMPPVTEPSSGSSNDKMRSNSRCVVEFDHPHGIRYQLNPNPECKVEKTETKAKGTIMEAWRRIFSGQKKP